MQAREAKAARPDTDGWRRWALAAGILTIAIVAAALVLDFSPFAERLSRQELIASGNEICAEAHDAFAQLQETPPRTAREAEDLTDRLVGIAEDELEELGDLSPPQELEPALDRYLEAREEGIDQLRAGAEAAADDDAAAYAEAQRRLAAGQRERFRLAREIGFSECSRPLRRRG